MVAVSVGEEDVFRPQFIDAKTGIQEEIELGNDEGCMPCCTGFSRQDVVAVGLGKAPLEDIGS